jgi:hypothetical protein
MGGSVASNRYCLVAGDNICSHGDGSINAGGDINSYGGKVYLSPTDRTSYIAALTAANGHVTNYAFVSWIVADTYAVTNFIK